MTAPDDVGTYEVLDAAPRVNPVGVLAWTVTVLLWAAAAPLLALVWRWAW